jgi:hypothetical protein
MTSSSSNSTGSLTGSLTSPTFRTLLRRSNAIRRKSKSKGKATTRSQ